MTAEELAEEHRKLRIKIRWRRGLHFRLDWTYLVFLVQYTDSVDAEGCA